MDEEADPFHIPPNLVPFPKAPVRPVGELPFPAYDTIRDRAIYAHLKQLAANANNLQYLITMGAMQLPEQPPNFFTWIHPQIGVSDLATSATLFQMEVINLLAKKK